MTIDSLLEGLEASFLGHLVNDSTWLFPALETAHFIGLILLIGSIAVVDLRLLGMGRTVPVGRVMPFLTWSFVGFTINAITGVLFFASDPKMYYYNLAFRLKVACIVLAGGNALWFNYVIGPKIRAGQWESVRVRAQVIGTLSLTFWFLVVIFGRLIPYLK